MSIEFNDPNFNPKDHSPLDPSSHKWSSADARIRHENFMKEITKGLFKGLRLKSEQESDMVGLWNEAQARIKLIRKVADDIVLTHADMGKQVDRTLFAEGIQTQYLNNFVHFSKDQLLVILTMHLAYLTVNEVM